MTEKKELWTIKPEDLVQLKFLQDGRLSPDGRTVAYTVSHIDAEKEGEKEKEYVTI
jgi:dipeptidyl aminopeptidase/acylaminoacyl peptidase